ncbi:cytochrome P450 [Nostoc sp. UHCC 0702]|nr:cytochrome P450 [Nostoc sp. UHCC 0702]
MQLPNRIKTPSLLQKIQWIFDPMGYMESSAQQYPDLFTGEVVGFGNTLVFVSHPQAMQQILTSQKSKFAADGQLNQILQPILGEYSLIMLGGAPHKRRRQLLMPSFHGDRMRAYGQLFYDIAAKVFNQLPIDQTFQARDATQEISLQVISQVLLGLHQGERCEQLMQLMVSMLDVFDSPLTSSFLLLPFLQQDLGAKSPWGGFVRQRQQVNELLHAEIVERRQKPNPDRIDILSLLMDATDEAGQPMTDEELRDEIKTLMFGGYETAATAMAWALYWIHRKPEVKEKLLQELDTLGDSPDPMTIFRLPYLTAICNETLRIYPIVMLTLPTLVQERVEILGYSLEPGTVAVGSIYLMHQREDLYPQPKEFRPERFLERQFTPYEFMPFGGVRRCIGEAMAIFEMKVVLAKILSTYELALVEQRPVRPQRRGVTLAPTSGIKLAITGRRQRQNSLVTTANTSIPLVVH